jgi:hypothetical protein
MSLHGTMPPFLFTFPCTLSLFSSFANPRRALPPLLSLLSFSSCAWPSLGAHAPPQSPAHPYPTQTLSNHSEIPPHLSQNRAQAIRPWPKLLQNPSTRKTTSLEASRSIPLSPLAPPLLLTSTAWRHPAPTLLGHPWRQPRPPIGHGCRPCPPPVPFPPIKGPSVPSLSSHPSPLRSHPTPLLPEPSKEAPRCSPSLLLTGGRTSCP